MLIVDAASAVLIADCRTRVLIPQTAEGERVAHSIKPAPVVARSDFVNVAILSYGLLLRHFRRIIREEVLEF